MRYCVSKNCRDRGSKSAQIEQPILDTLDRYAEFIQSSREHIVASALRLVFKKDYDFKGDFCHKVKGILETYERGEDYIEVSLHSEYRYNPLHNDLDAYALAYSIAALLNNLFGKGKEPFWQQAYTNLVKFIILLHKVAYDYVTLFDVYECAISPEVLEKRIAEAERKLSKFDIAVTPETYTAWVSDLKTFSFELDKPNSVYRAKAVTELCDMLRNKKVPFQFSSESTNDREFRKWEQLKP
ncbi:MAG TPA: hypothetical protein VJN92_21665 [Candidatus Acidoferrum sp.]|nr:hypothetical protein [Candidatus Acidoferrum sp.]